MELATCMRKMRNVYVTVVLRVRVRDVGVNGTVVIKYVLNETRHDGEEWIHSYNISSFRNKPEGLMRNVEEEEEV